MEIQEAVLHRLDKLKGVQGDGSVTVKEGEALLPIDELLTELATSLCALFNKTNVSYGTFGETTTFPERLQQYSKAEQGMMELSVHTTDLLRHHMERSNFATGGFALFVRYIQDQTEFLLLAMLKLKVSAGIGDDLRLQQSVNIDTSKLHEAARVNLTRRSKNEQPYLAFVKGDAKAGRVTDYFRDALACTDYTDAKHFTQQAIGAAKAFVEQRSDLTPEQKHEEYQQVKKRLVECFDSAGKGEVTPLALAAAVWPQRPEDFVEFSEKPEVANTYQVKAPFKPHAQTYRGLRRITGVIGTVRIAFDVDDVRTGRIVYDERTDNILVGKPGAELREKIRDATPAS